MILYGREKEVLKAQKRSLAAWINNTLGATLVDADNLISKLSTGVILCKLAKCIQQRVDRTAHCPHAQEEFRLKYWDRAKRESFFARDNAEMFIRWCKDFGVREAVLFESDGLVLQTQPRTVILCLLELSRLASRCGVLLPPPIQLPPATICIDDLTDGSEEEDEFLYSSNVRLKSSRCWDSGCSSPTASSARSKTPSPNSSLKKKGRDTRNVVVILRKSDFDEGDAIKAPRVSSAGRRRNASMVRSDTISSRMRATLSRSNSSILSSSRSSVGHRTSTHSLGSLSQHRRRSALDKRVSEVAGQYLKEEDRMRRLSEGRYAFGNKTVLLRMVRGNNVVVRIGGGWDTLEHFLSALEKKRRTPLATRRT